MSATVSTAPRFAGRPCVGLDVHKKTCTATWLDPGGVEREQWEFATKRGELDGFLRRIPEAAVIALEASTVGKAVCSYLRARGAEVLMASPRQLRAITTSAVKTDKRDSAHLARLVQADYFPQSWLPPPEIERIRTIVRYRMGLGERTTQVKNQVQSLVSGALLHEAMEGYSDWFGRAGLQALIALPLDGAQRLELRSLLEQLKVIAEQSAQMEREMARLGRDRKDVQLLMTIPGVDFYTALALIGEIGDIGRYPTKNHLASDAGLVPRADNSGEVVSKHRRVKPGNRVMKYFLMCAVSGMISSKKETSIVRFYHAKQKQIGTMKARVAAARKLARVVWKILSTEEPYVEEQERLTKRKRARMEREARKAPPSVTEEELQGLARALSGLEGALARLPQEDPL